MHPVHHQQRRRDAGNVPHGRDAKPSSVSGGSGQRTDDSPHRTPSPRFQLPTAYQMFESGSCGLSATRPNRSRYAHMASWTAMAGPTSLPAR